MRDEEEARHDEEAAEHADETPRPRGLTLLALLALVSSPFALPTFGIGAAIAVILLGVSWVLHRRGFAVRRVVAAALVSLVLSGASAGACWRLVLVPAEVEGEERLQQNDVERDFDRAFDEATAPPPPREGSKE